MSARKQYSAYRACGGGSGISRDAFGSVVRGKTSAGILHKDKSGGSGFISQNDPRPLFGRDASERAESIDVTWADGKVKRFDGDAAKGSTLLLKRGTESWNGSRSQKANLPKS